MATDDERIYDAVTAFGGKAEMTSAEHRSGTDRCWEAYCKHGGDFDVVINVQGDDLLSSRRSWRQSSTVSTVREPTSRRS